MSALRLPWIAHLPGPLLALLTWLEMASTPEVGWRLEATAAAWWMGTATGLAAALLVWLLRRRGLRRLPAPVLLAQLLLPFGLLLGRDLGLQRGGADPQWPDLVFVTVDTTRHDRWWFLQGADHLRRPDAEVLEARAVVFENAYANVALTAPAHASLFTGLHPHQHGVFNNGGVLAGRVTLAELLRGAGYRTLAAPSVIHLDPAFGFGRGFDDFAPVERGWGERLRRWSDATLFDLLGRAVPLDRAARGGTATLERARELWRSAAGDAPRFLWVHLFEPHWPHDPPTELASFVPEQGFKWAGEPPTPGFERADVHAWQRGYDAEVLEARELLADFLGRLRAERDENDRPLWVVLTADHGEAFGEHGSVDHGDLLYEEQLRVPLWIDAPGFARDTSGRELREPARIETPVSHVDLLPSLCEVFSLEVPERLPGRSWAPALQARSFETVPVFASTRHVAFDNHMVRWGRLKMIRQLRKTPSAMLAKPGRRPAGLVAGLAWRMFDLEAYDVVADPHELRPLEDGVGGRYPEAQRAGAALRAFEEERGPPPPSHAPGQGPGRAIIEALHQLGYGGE